METLIKPAYNNSLSAWDIVGCPSGVYHKKIGTVKPYLHPDVVNMKENFTRAAEMGKIIQREVRLRWRNAKILISEEKRIENDWNLWLKYDAICKAKGRTVLMEIKGVSDNHFQSFKETNVPRQDNKIQLILYHYFLKRGFKNLEAAIFYVNRKNPLDHLTIPVTYGDAEIDEINKKICYLNESIDRKSQPLPVASLILDSITGRYIVNPTAAMCDFHSVCTGDPDWFPKAKEECDRLNKKMFEKGGD